MTTNRIKDNICPFCLSKLLDENGSMQCSGDRLNIWQDIFIDYEKKSEIEKNNFIENFNEKDYFKDLYKRWKYLDENGKRSNFTCGYTNKIFFPLPDNRILVPDLLQVKKYERQLKRNLTKDEILGQKEIIINEKKVKLGVLVFPDDF